MKRGKILEFSIEQVKCWGMGVLLFTIGYVLLYSWKGQDKTVAGYINAINSCARYAICSIFAIVGYGLLSYEEWRKNPIRASYFNHMEYYHCWIGKKIYM